MSEGIVAALDYGRGNAGEEVTDRALEAFYDLYANPTLDPATATLDVIESSGRGRLLGDPELRLLLAEWRVHTADAVDQQDGLQRNREAMLWPALVRLDLRVPDGARARTDPRIGLPRPEALRDAGLPAILDLHSALLDRTRRDWVEVMEATTRVLDRLDALGTR